jgi:hypothetical protein
MTQAGPPKLIDLRGRAPGRIVTAVLPLASLAETPRWLIVVGWRPAPREPHTVQGMVGPPRALTARHVGVAPSIVNNNPETRERGRRSFPTAAGWCSSLNRLSSRPTLATARGEPGPITTGGDHGCPLSRGRPDGGTSFGQKAARAPLMLRSIAARSEYGCFHNSAALRCVSKHEGALRGRPHPSRRAHARSTLQKD